MTFHHVLTRRIRVLLPGVHPRDPEFRREVLTVETAITIEVIVTLIEMLVEALTESVMTTAYLSILFQSSLVVPMLTFTSSGKAPSLTFFIFTITPHTIRLRQ